LNSLDPLNSLGSHRRHPGAIVILLLLGLLATGGLYSLLAPKSAQAAVATADDLSTGAKLFLANCATCHGISGHGSADGPTLAGVGAAAVDFQVGTGRMPLAVPGAQQAARGQAKLTDEQIASLAAYVATLGSGPPVPDSQYTKGDGNIALGNELFKVNCAMCHNFAGSGGALTRGKYAPSLRNVTGKHIYEAMVTGPESMPVFNDNNLSPTDKNDIISYLHELDKNKNPGGLSLGNLGPVSEGMFVWIFGLGLMIGAAVWLGSKAA
jgi:ubiquinol-cytochrome c reductase cytochrome c subunit